MVKVLLISHNGEVTVAATNGISVSAGGIKLSDGKLRVEKGGVGATKEVVTSNTEIAGSIEVNGGALYQAHPHSRCEEQKPHKRLRHDL